MRKIILIAILLISFGVAAYTFYTSWRMQDPSFQRERTIGAVRMLETPDTDRELVNLDDLAQVRPAKAGTREIGPLKPITFNAAIKEGPKVISTDYLQQAFGVLKIAPVPAVSKRMFVETEKGYVMPVYVWDDVAASFAAGPEPRQMVGFHVYTYAKGPAIVVDGLI